jgi:hypothetical protein
MLITGDQRPANCGDLLGASYLSLHLLLKGCHIYKETVWRAGIKRQRDAFLQNTEVMGK